MAFKPGDDVHVAGLGKGTVREARKGGRCLVEIKGRAVLVDERQVTALVQRPRRPKTQAPGASDTEPPPVPAPASIDLHGLTPEEALATLDAFINDAILAGHATVRVIHGRGAGRLRAAVHQRLGAIAAVRSVRLDPANPGVIIATL